jgi:hypothetical protein
MFQALFLGWNENSTQWFVPLCCRGEKLITHTHCAEVKKHGAIPPFAHTSSWRGAPLFKRKNEFTFFTLTKSQDESSLRTQLKISQTPAVRALVRENNLAYFLQHLLLDIIKSVLTGVG